MRYGTLVDGQIVRVWTETEQEPVPVPRELTPAEQRELAYDTAVSYTHLRAHET